MAYFHPSKADYLTPCKHLSWERGYQHGAEDLTITHVSYTVKRSHQLTQVPEIQTLTAEPFGIQNSLKAAGNCIHIILKSNVVSDVA